MFARIFVFYSCGSAGALAAMGLTQLLFHLKLTSNQFTTLSFLDTEGNSVYARLVFGGVWAVLGLLPGLYKLNWLQCGLVISSFPTLIQFLYFLPISGAGLFGSSLGKDYPLYVVLVNLFWGLSTSFFAMLLHKKR